MVHQLCIALCAHAPQSALLPSLYIGPLYPGLAFLFSDPHTAVRIYELLCVVFSFISRMWVKSSGSGLILTCVTEHETVESHPCCCKGRVSVFLVAEWCSTTYAHRTFFIQSSTKAQLPFKVARRLLWCPAAVQGQAGSLGILVARRTCTEPSECLTCLYSRVGLEPRSPRGKSWLPCVLSARKAVWVPA